MCTSKSTTSSLTHGPPNVFGYVAAALTIAVTAVVAYMEARLPHQRSLSYATNKVATPSHGTLCTRLYAVPRGRAHQCGVAVVLAMCGVLTAQTKADAERKSDNGLQEVLDVRWLCRLRLSRQGEQTQRVCLSGLGGARDIKNTCRLVWK